MPHPLPFCDKDRVEHRWSWALVIIAKELIQDILWLFSFWGTNEHHHCKTQKNRVNESQKNLEIFLHFQMFALLLTIIFFYSHFLTISYKTL